MSKHPTFPHLRVPLSLAMLASGFLVPLSTVSALMFGQAEMGGLQFRVLSIDLAVSTNPAMSEPGDFSDSAGLNGAQELEPGGTEVSESFWVKNISGSDRNLRVLAQLSGQTETGLLEQAVQMRIVTPQFQQEPWWSLAEWSANQWPLPQEELAPGEARRYTLQYRIPARYPADPDGEGPFETNQLIGDELSGKASGPWSFDLTGVPLQ